MRSVESRRVALLRFRWDQGGRKASDFAVRSTSTGAAEERPPRAGPLLPARSVSQPCLRRAQGRRQVEEAEAARGDAEEEAGPGEALGRPGGPRHQAAPGGRGRQWRLQPWDAPPVGQTRTLGCGGGVCAAPAPAAPRAEDLSLSPGARLQCHSFRGLAGTAGR